MFDILVHLKERLTCTILDCLIALRAYPVLFFFLFFFFLDCFIWFPVELFVIDSTFFFLFAFCDFNYFVVILGYFFFLLILNIL